MFKWFGTNTFKGTEEDDFILLEILKQMQKLDTLITSFGFGQLLTQEKNSKIQLDHMLNNQYSEMKYPISHELTNDLYSQLKYLLEYTRTASEFMKNFMENSEGGKNEKPEENIYYNEILYLQKENRK